MSEHEDRENAKDEIAQAAGRAKGVLDDAASDAAEARQEVIVVEKVAIMGLLASVRFIKWLLFVMFVIMVGAVVQSRQTQDAADQSTRASTKASEDLAKAIEASQSGAVNPEAITIWFTASIRAECLLDNEVNDAGRECGPPPPPLPTETTTTTTTEGE